MDLLKITKSKTREKIFQLFFSDIEKKYYVRELERMLKISAGNIRRELLFLEKTGLLKREKMGREIYYYLNKNSAIFEDFKNIVSKTIGIESILKKSLDRVKKIQAAFIFGSFATKKGDAFSDIDLMIIGNPDENLLIENIGNAEEKIHREINYNIFSAQELKDGWRRKEVFLEEVIEKPKKYLIGDDYVLEKIIGRRQPSGKKSKF